MTHYEWWCVKSHKNVEIPIQMKKVVHDESMREMY